MQTISPEQETGTSDPLARDLGGFLKFLLHRTGRDFYAFVGELELTVTQMRILQFLSGDVDDASLKQIAASLEMSMPAVSRAVDSLFRRGLVTRAENAADRRVKAIRITDDAVELVDRAIGMRIAGLEDFVSTLSDGQRTRLAAALAPIVEREDVAPMCTRLSSPAPRKDSSDA